MGRRKQSIDPCIEALTLAERKGFGYGLLSVFAFIAAFIIVEDNAAQTGQLAGIVNQIRHLISLGLLIFGAISASVAVWCIARYF